MTRRNTTNDYNSEGDSDSMVKKELLSQCSEGESSLNNSRKKKRKRKVKHEQSIEEESKFTEQMEKEIKAELLSDIDTNKRKKKKVKKLKDESFSNIKVEEKFSLPSPIKHKKKKHDINNSSQNIDEDAALSEFDNSISFKKKSMRDSFNSEAEIELVNTITEPDTLSDSEPTQQKRKSKKGIKKSKEEDNSMDIEDYFSAGETQVQIVTSEENTKNCNQEVNGSSAKDSTSSKSARLNSISSTNDHLEHDDINSDSSSSSNRVRLNSQNNLNMKAPIISTRSKGHNISDRIVFEDDVNYLVNLSKNTTENVDADSKFSYNMRKYLTMHTHLQKHTETLSDDAIVSQDDEIWLIKCPSEVTVDAFHNINLTMDSKCKIKVNGQKFEGIMEDHHDRLAVLSQENEDFVIRNMALKGCIWFHRRLPKCIQTDVYNSEDVQGSFIPLPVMKRRHPLLGANYESALHLPADVKERLIAADKKEKRPKLLTETPDSEPVVKEKKRKRKHTETEMETPSNGPKKPKKGKKSRPPSTVWESEQAIGENLFNY